MYRIALSMIHPSVVTSVDIRRSIFPFLARLPAKEESSAEMDPFKIGAVRLSVYIAFRLEVKLPRVTFYQAIFSKAI